MRDVDFTVRSSIKRTPRVMQLEGLFDVPAKAKLEHRWRGGVPLDEKKWNVGLIVGPSGAGKSTVAGQLFKMPKPFAWKAASVIDDFAKGLSMEAITAACSAVGFNTIPSWMKPHHVLSTGEQFRVDLARALLELPDPIVIDEFTSVIDRQVAHIGCNAVQKLVRRDNRQFVAVTCHHDVEEWLQPDWVLEPATMQFRWRSVQRRPQIHVEICRVAFETWKLFAPFHYMSADLSRSATCFALFVDGKPVTFAGVLHRPHPKVRDVKGISRVVTLPDYQGMGLSFVLMDALGSIYTAAGYRLRMYPAHPSFIRAMDRSENWRLEKQPGVFSEAVHGPNSAGVGLGGRACAVFEYAGPVLHPADTLEMFAERIK